MSNRLPKRRDDATAAQHAKRVERNRRRRDRRKFRKAGIRMPRAA